jgi:hypothetical protein
MLLIQLDIFWEGEYKVGAGKSSPLTKRKKSEGRLVGGELLVP